MFWKNVFFPSSKGEEKITSKETEFACSYFCWSLWEENFCRKAKNTNLVGKKKTFVGTVKSFFTTNCNNDTTNKQLHWRQCRIYLNQSHFLNGKLIYSFLTRFWCPSGLLLLGSPILMSTQSSRQHCVRRSQTQKRLRQIKGLKLYYKGHSRLLYQAQVKDKISPLCVKFNVFGNILNLLWQTMLFGKFSFLQMA